MRIFDLWVKKVKDLALSRDRFTRIQMPGVEINPIAGLELKVLELTKGRKEKACVITTHSAFRAMLAGGADLSHEYYAVVEECSLEAVEELWSGVQEVHPAILIAAGGGKCLDTAKLLKQRTGLPLIAVPTSPATCSAFSPISVVYSPEGEYKEVVDLDVTPDLVWLDWDLLLSSPSRMLRAGMGDALAKWLEAKAVLCGLPGQPGKDRGLGSKIQVECEANGQAAFELARECALNIARFGEQAVADHESMARSQAWQDMLWSNVMTSGMASYIGGADLPAAAAHTFANALTAVPRAKTVLHGEAVALGSVVQALLLEGQGADSSERLELVALLRRLGLPCRLQETALGNLTPEETSVIVKKAFLANESMEALPFKVRQEEFQRAITDIGK